MVCSAWSSGTSEITPGQVRQQSKVTEFGSFNEVPHPCLVWTGKEFC